MFVKCLEQHPVSKIAVDAPIEQVTETKITERSQPATSHKVDPAKGS
jgi:hypothetical protein